MKKQGTGNREQGVGATGFRTGATVLYRREECQVSGCSAIAVGGPYCDDCTAQIAALHEWHRLHDGRDSHARMAVFHACSWVRRRLWIPMLLLLAGTMAYLGFLVAGEVGAWRFLEGGL